MSNTVSVIISGPSFAPKSTIASKLVATGYYSLVKSSTTAPKKSGNSVYSHLSQQEFSQHNEVDWFFHDECDNFRYGILTSDRNSIEPSKRPIYIVPTKLANELTEKLGDALWFYIDAKNNENLDEPTQIEEYSYSSNATYVLESNSNNIEKVVELINELVKLYHVGGGLSYRIIDLMLDCGMLLDNSSKDSIKGASYDLLLGDEYYYCGEIKKLSDASSFLKIEPYDYAIVSCKESARIPRDVMGKFGLSVGLFCQGIILSNGPQIDPGFRGTLFCLLFNTSNRTVYLKRGMHYATIEFNKLVEPAPPYEGYYQDKNKIIEYIPANALQGAIHELKNEIENLKKESRVMQNVYLTVVGIVLTIISVILALK